MKKRALKKELFRTIRRTWNRYLAILMIVGLGVAFFAGVRSTRPDMQLSADTYFDERNFYDIRVLGTLGMTEKDAEQIAKLDGVEAVEPAYSVDVLCNTKDQRLVVKMMTVLPDINKLELIEGRLPNKSGECFADARFMETTGLQLGDTITVESGTEDAISDSLAVDTYTIVGMGNSPLYLSIQRGSSTIGSGSVNSFLAILPEDFTIEAYTELYVTTKDTDQENAYGQAYQDKVEGVLKQIEAMEDTRCEVRYQEVQAEASDKLSEGEKELAEGKDKIADAEEQLQDAREQLADAKEKIADGEAELEKQSKKLADGKKELADGEKELEEAEPKLKDALDELEKGQKEIDTRQQELYEGYDAYNSGIDSYEDGKKALKDAENELAKQQEQYEAMKPYMTEEMKATAEKQFADAQKQIEDNKIKLEEGKAELDSAWWQLESGQLKLTDARKELQTGWEEYNTGLQEYEDGKKELEENKQKLIDGEKKLADAKVTLADAKKEYEEAQVTFTEEEQKAQDKITPAKQDIAEAEEKLADAKQEIADLEVPKWYVLDRDSNQTYAEYGQDADRIGAIGEVFPAIFFLVAALVALTSMTRMVEEERTQIGTLKALGYSDRSIAGKYIFYALSASLLGSLIGLVAGQKILPYVIITAYKILYQNLPQVLTPLSLVYSVSSTAVAVLCTSLATFLACHNELREQPSVLMRPQAPKGGKRVLLERITFLWKRLNFTSKSTIRNLFRYKKRLFMTIFGIGGCMALLIVAFGLKDAIYVVGNEQFTNIIKYHAAVTLEDDLTGEELETLETDLLTSKNVADHMYGYMHLMDGEKGTVSKEIYLVVPADETKMDQYVSLRERTSGRPITLTEDGAVISEKLATMLDVKPGDTMVLKEDDVTMDEITVAAITENYYLNYVYMSHSYYEKVFGEKAEHNTVFLHEADTTEATEEKTGQEILSYQGVSQITFYSSLSDRIRDMLKSMDSIIMVLVLSAGALAFIVLYNLNNINVTERKRELSTLKVLGFYDVEVSSYVFRENVVLTILGCALGLVLGTALNRFVVLTAEVDAMMFGRKIQLISYCYSVVLTFLFSLIVNVAMHFSLKKVDMLEALKSIE